MLHNPSLIVQEKDARDIEIPNIRWEVFELMMRYNDYWASVLTNFFFSLSGDTYRSKFLEQIYIHRVS